MPGAVFLVIALFSFQLIQVQRLMHSEDYDDIPRKSEVIDLNVICKSIYV